MKLYRRLNIELLKLHRLALRNPRKVAVFFFICVVLMAPFLGQLKFELSSEDMIDEGFSSSRELKHFYDEFGHDMSSIFLIQAPTGHIWTEPELCQIRGWYIDEITKNGDIESGFSVFDVRLPKSEPTRLFYPKILDLNCAEPSDSPTRTAEVQKLFEQIRQTPWGPFLTEKGDLAFRFQYKKSESRMFGSFNPDVLDPIKKRWSDFKLKFSVPVKEYWVGAADYQSYLKEGLQRSSVINLVFLVILFFLLRLFLGTYRAGGFYVFILFLGGYFIYSGKALAGSAFDNLSNSLFLMLGVASLEDFIFLSAAQLNGKSWRTAFRRLVIPSFYTSLTTTLGFLSLLTSDLGIIRRLAAWSALGAAIEWLLLILLLPALLEIFNMHNWVNEKKAFFISKLPGLVKMKPRKSFALLLLAVYPAVFIFSKHLNFNDSPENMMPKSHIYRQDLKYAQESRGFSGTTSVLFATDLSIEKQKELEDQMRSWPGVVSIDSYQVVDQFLRSKVDPPSQAVVHEAFYTAPASDTYLGSSGERKSTIYLKKIDIEDLRSFRGHVAELCPKRECWAVGGLMAYSEIAEEIPRTLFLSLWTSMILVGCVLSFLYWAEKQTKHMIPVILSSFWGPVVMLGCLIAIQFPINYLTCIVASVLVGLTGDNAIMFLFANSHQPLDRRAEKRGPAAVLTATSMALVSLVFLGSYFAPPKIFGLLLCGGFLVSLFGDYWILQALIKKKEP